MVTINIICTGKIKEKYLKDAIDEYSKRLSKFCKLNILELPDKKIPDKSNPSIENEIKNIEGENVISHLKKDTCVICLDLKGKQFSSEEFAQDIQDISMLHSNITFIIGGSLGMSEKLLNLANQKICFSKMTFPHQLIRVFLLEQIYRAFKIINGENYHK
jgi:23S rRNA (pseudouridine1915-N3)-methyltransferase